MKILITSIVDLRKTSPNRLHQFIKYLSKNHEISVLSINDWWKSGQTDVSLYSKDFEDVLQKIDIIHLTKRRINPYLQEAFSFVGFGKLLNKEDYDVHFNYNTLISGYFVAKKMKSAGINTVYDIADNLPEMIRSSPQIPTVVRPIGGVVGNMMFRKNIEIARKVVVVTGFLEKLCNIPQNKSELVPNGVNTEMFKNYPSNQLREELGIDQSFVIGYVGVLREWVDLEPVFVAVKKLNKNIKILIVGEEGLFKENVNLVKKYGIADKVLFTGTVPYAEVPRYISSMDACLIPFSKNKVTEDPCPLKLFEYMACEKPVISTVFISAVQNKILYASTVEEYENRIVELYNNEDLRKKLGADGRNFVKENYDWSKIALSMEKILMGMSS